MKVQTINFRPLVPEDSSTLEKEYLKLSDESKLQRFLSPMPRLTNSLLRQLVDKVDGVEHVALVAEILDEEDRPLPIGIGRMIRYKDEYQTVDVAVTVKDEWQGQGVGSRLMEELLRVMAEKEPVTHIKTEVLPSNRASLSMLSKFGEVTNTRGGEPGCSTVVKLY